MNHLPYFVIAIILIGVFVAMFANRWLLNVVKPKMSAQRFILYFVVVLAVGFLLTVLFSFIILKLMLVYK